MVGLETAMQSVYRSGVEDEEQVKTELLQLVKNFANFITPSTESEYRDALLREYRTFVAKMERGQRQESSVNR
jgi:hypothetical protein